MTEMWNAGASGPGTTVDGFTITHVGHVAVLGYLDEAYLVCVRNADGSAGPVLERFARDDAGWGAAWVHYNRVESGEIPVPQRAMPEGIPAGASGIGQLPQPGHMTAGVIRAPGAVTRHTAEPWLVGSQERMDAAGPDTRQAHIPKAKKGKSKLNLTAAAGALLAAVGIAIRIELEHSKHVAALPNGLHNVFGGNAGLVAMKFGSYVAFIGAFFLGVTGHRQVRRSDGRQRGKLFAWLAILGGWAFLIFVLLEDLIPGIMHSFHNLGV